MNADTVFNIRYDKHQFLLLCFIILFMIGFFIAFLFGLALIFFTRLIFKWSVDKFSGWSNWLVQKLYGKNYKPTYDPYEQVKWRIWYYRIWGIALVVLSAFALYGLITLFL